MYRLQIYSKLNDSQMSAFIKHFVSSQIYELFHNMATLDSIKAVSRSSCAQPIIYMILSVSQI